MKKKLEKKEENEWEGKEHKEYFWVYSKFVVNV